MESAQTAISPQAVKQIVMDIIADIAPDQNMETLDSAKELKSQLELDSMDFLDIVMELRRRHKIEVPAQDYSQLATLNSCVEYLTPKFQLQ